MPKKGQKIADQDGYVLRKGADGKNRWFADGSKDAGKADSSKIVSGTSDSAVGDFGASGADTEAGKFERIENSIDNFFDGIEDQEHAEKVISYIRRTDSVSSRFDPYNLQEEYSTSHDSDEEFIFHVTAPGFDNDISSAANKKTLNRLFPEDESSVQLIGRGKDAHPHSVQGKGLYFDVEKFQDESFADDLGKIQGIINSTDKDSKFIDEDDFREAAYEAGMCMDMDSDIVQMAVKSFSGKELENDNSADKEIARKEMQDLIRSTLTKENVAKKFSELAANGGIDLPYVQYDEKLGTIDMDPLSYFQVLQDTWKENDPRKC